MGLFSKIFGWAKRKDLIEHDSPESINRERVEKCRKLSSKLTRRSYDITDTTFRQIVVDAALFAQMVAAYFLDNARDQIYAENLASKQLPQIMAMTLGYIAAQKDTSEESMRTKMQTHEALQKAKNVLDDLIGFSLMYDHENIARLSHELDDILGLARTQDGSS